MTATLQNCNSLRIEEMRNECVARNNEWRRYFLKMIKCFEALRKRKE
jgi:hypothetical protein